MYDVITFGSATVDVFAKTDAELITISHGHEEEELIAYECGSKILIEKLDFQIGGGGTNTAVAFSRLGLKTGFCGALGKGSNAERILNLLKKEKIDFLGIQTKGQTGYSVILDSEYDDRTILTFKGVNNLLKYKDLDKNMLKAKWFYFSSLVGESYKTFEKLTAYAKKNKIKVAFNPSSYIAKHGKKFLAKALKNTDFLILNKEEAELTLGKEDKINKLLLGLSKTGAKIVTITDGKKGAYTYDKSSKKILHIPGRKMRIKETTGAGDSFASGFLAGLMLKNNIGYALKLGQANASSVITHIGAKNKLLTLKEAQKAIKGLKIKTIK